MAPNKPIHEVKVGALKATFWKNQTKNGDMLTVSFARLYKDRDDKWATSGSYTKEDLGTLVALISQSVNFLETSS